MEIYGEIKGIKYKPFLNKSLASYTIDKLDKALSEKASFILEFDDKNAIAISWWVSPKRTRSYPYARVYDTLGFTGKRVTIIPVIKDEGKDGDRDFLQWDTISLMSLLGVYVIIGYYIKADKNPRYQNKITNQRFDVDYIKEEIQRLLSYQSDALHWNIGQIDKIHKISEKAIENYEKISKKLNVKLHSLESAKKRIEEIYKNKENFIQSSRLYAREAQIRESKTKQPKENIKGMKAKITIKNYLGGLYYFTCDEIEIYNNKVYLIEAKHSSRSVLPSEEDIKDGLIKMVLYSNLENVFINKKEFKFIPVLKLTTKKRFNENKLTKQKLKFWKLLKREAKTNKFKIKINNKIINS